MFVDLQSSMGESLIIIVIITIIIVIIIINNGLTTIVFTIFTHDGSMVLVYTGMLTLGVY